MGQVTLTQQCLRVTFLKAWEVNHYSLILLLLQAKFVHDLGKKIPSSHYTPFVPLHTLASPPSGHLPGEEIPWL